MQSCVILLRGINVGGKNRLPMADLKSVLNDLGCEDVATYIQSGNAVCRSPIDLDVLSSEISRLIAERFKFEPDVLVLRGDAYEALVNAQPFVDDDGKFSHTWFLKEPAKKDASKRLQALATATEAFELHPAAFYLHAPDGIGRSKLAAAVERCLGVPCTARNGRTNARLVEMLRSLDGPGS